jgi:NADPH:quinone reductase-like Zn-dependent oxidoreductase
LRAPPRRRLDRQEDTLAQDTGIHIIGTMLMKAIVVHNNRLPVVPVCEEIEKPVAGDDEVLIKVRAASVNPADRLVLFIARVSRVLAWLNKPKAARMGADVAGEVVAVGKNITQFKPGDAVYGVCRGGLAEYACAREDKIASKPTSVSFEEAAAMPIAAVTALQGLRDHGRIRPGQHVLVDGASGGVGTFAVQLAKSFGAEVTAVCSTRNLAQARSLGADHVVDYTRQDFTNSGERYDLIVAANAHHSIFAYRRSLAPGGTCVMVGGGAMQIVQVLALAPVLSRLGRRKIVRFIANISPKDLTILKELVETGTIKPAIDRRYVLSDAADAYSYLIDGHAKGKIVVTI